VNETVSGLEVIKSAVRNVMRIFARWLNKLSGGRLSPNGVTYTGLAAHIGIALIIAMRHPLPAAILLIVFGLFDSLDGELARLQHRASSRGMLLDSVSDRLKEILLYIGLAYAIIAIGRPYAAVWAVAVCGVSLLISYMNAWGEVVVSSYKTAEHAVNKTFRGGLMGFEIRMVFLILGLLANRYILAIMLITILGFVTVIQRFVSVTSQLPHDKS
jgi:phosphatidylglycerophosphate synthase